jgi:hypothetical protein
MLQFYTVGGGGTGAGNRKNKDGSREGGGKGGEAEREAVEEWGTLSFFMTF